MAGVNNDTMHNDELLDDGEVINGETNGVNYPFAFVRHGEDCRWWEYKIPDNNELLVSFSIHITKILMIIRTNY
jgi:hypothetical protein